MEEKKIPFKCQNPKCGTVFRMPLGWFKDLHHVHWFNCGQEFTVEAEKIPELKARLAQISKSY
jgi:hypothetical protein